MMVSALSYICTVRLARSMQVTITVRCASVGAVRTPRLWVYYGRVAALSHGAIPVCARPNLHSVTPSMFCVRFDPTFPLLEDRTLCVIRCYNVSAL
jgi:hypothetical protein